MKATTKTSATILFHGPANDKVCRSVITRLAKQHGGKFSYNSFWYAHQRRWHSADTTGRAAFKAIVPIAQYRAAVKAARQLSAPGLTYIRHHSHWG